jgi:hypothetical protein
MLGKLLKQRHASFAAGRLRVHGRLTDRCAICGATMTREGFRAWIDQPSPHEASQRVAGRLGLNRAPHHHPHDLASHQARRRGLGTPRTQAREGARHKPADMTLEQLRLMAEAASAMAVTG